MEPCGFDFTFDPFKGRAGKREREGRRRKTNSRIVLPALKIQCYMERNVSCSHRPHCTVIDGAAREGTAQKSFEILVHPHREKKATGEDIIGMALTTGCLT